MNHLNVERGIPASDTSYMVNLSYVIMIFATIFSGWISDKIGKSEEYFQINIVHDHRF
jgi:MFS family permease